MRKYFKYAIYLVVLIRYSSVFSGSYDDFFIAIKRDDVATVQNLLQRGFDVNTKDPNEQNGLYLAFREPSLRVAKVLIDWPATDFDAINGQDETALMMAVLKGHNDLALQIIRKVDDVNKTGWTPLHYAATSGNVVLISALLEKHAYIDAESPNGTTPLMMAAQYGTPSAVKLLLDEGADPLLRNALAFTAIDFAQSGKRLDSAEIIGSFLRAKQPKGKW